MSIMRFKQEISGELDEQVAKRKGEPNTHYWQKNAEKEVARILERYENGELLIDEYGVAYWASNNHAVPEDIAYMGKYGGLPIDLEMTKELEDRQAEQAIAEYRERMKDHVYTEEELGEMRAEFGAGKVVVDVITGRRIKL